MKRHERIFWGAAILLLPFVFSGAEEGMREPKSRFLICLMGLFLSWKLAERVSVVLGCATAVVYLWAQVFSLGFPAFTLLTFSAALGSCLIVVQAREDDVKRGLELLEIVGLACAAYAMIFQLKNHDLVMRLIPGADFHRVMAFFGQHTLYGPFAVACAACALFRERYLRAAVLFSPIFAIDASFTYLSAGVVVAMFLIYRFGTRAVLGLSIMGAVSAGGLAYVYSTQDYVQYDELNDNGRFALWKIVLRISEARPLLGHGGIGSFAEQFPIFQSKERRQMLGIDDEKIYTPEAKKLLDRAEELRNRSGFFVSAHNEFLEAFYEFGVVGLFFAILLPVTFLWWWVISSDSVENWILGAIFFSVIANSLGNFPLHLIQQALLPLWDYVLVTTERDRSILSL